MPIVQPRQRTLLWALACAAVVVVLGLAYHLHPAGLDAWEHRLGSGLQGWTVAHAVARHVLVGVAVAAATLPMTIYTLLTAAVLAGRRHVRTAVWTVVVMALAGLSVVALKSLVQRPRPRWADPILTLHTYSFPSGHATGIGAAAGVAIVLTTMFVRRRGPRRILVVTALVVAVLVGLDRVLLGVHHPSDVLGGWALGGFWVLLGLTVYSPSTPARPQEEFATPVPTSRTLAVVLNPTKVEDQEAFRAMVERSAQAAGWSRPQWHLTTAADPGRSMAEAAAIGGAEVVLVCGGDGTVRTVCAELAGTGVSVGIVPLGTGNLLARNLKVPLYLQAAVEVGLSGQDRAIDLVRVSGDGIPEDEHFMVMAGMGLDAAVMEGANEKVKARVGWLAYVASALRNLMFPAVRLEMSVDGGEWTQARVRTVVIGNVGYLQAGMPLLPDALIDDGLIDAVLLHPSRVLSWIPLVVRVLSRGRRTDDLVNRVSGRTISLRAQSDTPRQLDGDSIGAGRELHAECVHGRLLVRVPR